MERYTYATITPEQAIRITRYASTHTTDITRCRAVVRIAGATFDKDMSTSLLKSYKDFFFEDFAQALKAVGREGAILLQICEEDAKKTFTFFEKI